MKRPRPTTQKAVRKTRIVVTSIRPPAVVVDAVIALARERNCSRCQVIRDVIEGYLNAETTQVDPSSVRIMYATLRSKLPERPISFACAWRTLATYKLAARMLRTRSVAGLLTLAVVDLLGLSTLEPAAAA